MTLSDATNQGAIRRNYHKIMKSTHLEWLNILQLAVGDKEERNPMREWTWISRQSLAIVLPLLSPCSPLCLAFPVSRADRRARGPHPNSFRLWRFCFECWAWGPRFDLDHLPPDYLSVPDFWLFSFPNRVLRDQKKNSLRSVALRPPGLFPSPLPLVFPLFWPAIMQGSRKWRPCCHS